MRKLLSLNFALILSFLSLYSLGSHVPGGNITYECVGPNTYVVTLTLFEDCGTAFESNGPENITISNDCGFANPSGSLPNTVYQQEISQLCTDDLPLSECNGGSLPGVYIHQWQDTIVLPGDCDSWTFAYSSCCRNTSNNVSGQPGYYWESVLNSQTQPCNTSPQITNPVVPYVCNNQPVCYNLGVIETDGDSLVYSLIGAQSAAGTFVTYLGGATGANPINGITIDPQTGLINFTPTTTGNYVVVVLIEEFDANGNLIGSVIHDIQFEVINCTNSLLNCGVSGGMFNLTGAVTQTGPYSLEMCEGVPFSFQIAFQDPDQLDSLSVSTNIALALPGSNLTFNHPNGGLGEYDTLVVTVSWTPPPGSANSNNAFNIVVSDNSCPVPGEVSFVYNFNVLGATVLLSDTIVCNDQDITLIGAGPNAVTFDWSILSGDPNALNSLGGCTTCDTLVLPGADVQTTTVIELETDSVTSCDFRDTVTITIVPDYQWNVDPIPAAICQNDTSQLDINFTPAGSYTIDWQGAPVTGDTIIHPGVGSHVYPIIITSPQGCVELDTVTMDVAPAPTLTPVNVQPPTCPGVDNAIIEFLGDGFGSTGTYDLTGASTGSNSTGLFDNLPEGMYTITFTDSIGCSSSTNINLPDGTGLTVNTTVTDEICDVNGDGQLDISSPNANGTSTFDISGTETGSNNSGQFTDLQDGVYYILVTDSLGCTGVDTVNIAAGTVLDATITTNATSCDYNSDGSIEIVPTNGLAPYTFVATIAGISDTSTTSPIGGLSDGSYIVTMIDGNGCLYYDTVIVAQGPSVLSSFIPNPATGVEPLVVNFDNNSSAGTNTYFWDFDNGNSSTDENPTETFTEGQYQVMLVSSDGNCVDTSYQTITVILSSYLNVYNVITPNDDNINDEWYVEHESIIEYNVEIFDRWGVKVFESNDVNSRWDGTNQGGGKVSDGQYMYIIVAKGLDDVEYNLRGHISVFRNQ